MHILSWIALTCWIRRSADILPYHPFSPRRLELMYIPSFSTSHAQLCSPVDHVAWGTRRMLRTHLCLPGASGFMRPL